MKQIPVRQIAPSIEHVVSGRFKIRDIAEMLGGKDLVQKLHRHDFFFILALEKGAGTHIIDFTPYNVHGNAVFLLLPGQVHELELKAGSTGFLLEFDAAFYHPSGKLRHQGLIRAGNKCVCEFGDGSFKKVISLLSSMFTEYVDKQEGYVDVIKANLDVFFIEYTRQSKNAGSVAKNAGSYAQERLEDFLEVLKSNVKDKKHVSEYAELLNLSTYQLNAITKTTVGKLASEIISEQIILEAKRYLLATASQVKDIADFLGYEDISYFIRFFKKQTGYSPEAFRKKFK